MEAKDEHGADFIENHMLVEDDNFIMHLVFVAKKKGSHCTSEKMVMADVTELYSFKFNLN